MLHVGSLKDKTTKYFNIKPFIWISDSGPALWVTLKNNTERTNNEKITYKKDNIHGILKQEKQKKAYTYGKSHIVLLLLKLFEPFLVLPKPTNTHIIKL